MSLVLYAPRKPDTGQTCKLSANQSSVPASRY